MTGTYIFTHPEQLHSFASHAENEDSVPVHIKLDLLHALEDDALLAASRNPGSKFQRDARGIRYDRPSESEYLDLTTVGKTWREALLSVPPNLVKRVTFGQTLPQTLQFDGQDVPLHWETTLEGAGVAVLIMDVSSLIIGMATVLRMRCGGAVTFDTVYDVRERPMDPHVRELDEILRKLSR